MNSGILHQGIEYPMESGILDMDDESIMYS